MSFEKEKYILTEDIINIRTEPVQHNEIKSIMTKGKNHIKVRISLNIDNEIKTGFHLHCVKNKKAMTDVIEYLITEFLNKNK
jgi:chromosome segregation and condensation protein ScpB